MPPQLGNQVGSVQVTARFADGEEEMHAGRRGRESFRAEDLPFPESLARNDSRPLSPAPAEAVSQTVAAAPKISLAAADPRRARTQRVHAGVPTQSVGTRNEKGARPMPCARCFANQQASWRLTSLLSWRP